MQVNSPFGDQGNLYSTNKVVYLSPSFFGFDGGLSFEPSTAVSGNSNSGDCGPTAAPGQFFASGQSVATPGCSALSSTSTNDVQRRRNTYEALLRYRGTFGAFGLAATAAYTGSGRVTDSGGAGSTTNPKHYPLEDLSIGDFGLAVTYGGLSVGGNFEFGRFNLQSSGGFGALIAKHQPNGNALITGFSYTVGPVIFGADYLRYFVEGEQTTATNASTLGVPVVANSVTGVVLGGQRFGQGASAGLTYSLAPGVALYFSSLWVQDRQRGYNFITGQSINAGNNKVSASVYAIGTSFAWKGGRSSLRDVSHENTWRRFGDTVDRDLRQ